MVLHFDLLSLFVVSAEGFSHVGNQHVQEMDLHQELEANVNSVQVYGLRRLADVEGLRFASIGKIPSEPKCRLQLGVRDTKCSSFKVNSATVFSFWALFIRYIVVNLVVAQQEEGDGECGYR